MAGYKEAVDLAAGAIREGRPHPTFDDAARAMLKALGVTPQSLYAERRRTRTAAFHARQDAERRAVLEQMGRELSSMDLPPEVRAVVEKYYGVERSG